VAAAGVLGIIIPNTSPWGMILLGALAGAFKEAPKIVQSLVDAILEYRKISKSSISYVSKFLKS
jgi:hypothetical protein